MIEISLPEEYEDLKPTLERKIDEAMAERKSLGMTYPKKFNVEGVISTGEEARGIASSSNVMYLDLLHICSNLYASDFDSISDYVKQVALIAPNIFFIHRALRFPLQYVAFCESRDTSKFVEEFSKRFDSEGFNYDEFKQTAQENANRLEEILAEIRPNMVNMLEETNTIRHELDHLDFHGSVLYFEASRWIQEFGNEIYWHEATRIPEKNKILVGASSKGMLVDILLTPLIETRAYYFSSVPPNGFSSFDFEAAKKYVNDYLNETIMRTYSKTFLSYVFNDEKARKNVNIETAKEVLKRTKGKPYQESEAEERMYGHLMNVLNYCKEMTKPIIQVVGEAFRDDPTRFTRANRVASFGEYFDICRSSELPRYFMEYVQQVDDILRSDLHLRL